MNEKSHSKSKSLTTVVVVIGFIAALALWDSGWKPHNAFLAGIVLMLSPGFIIVGWRMFENRSGLVRSYEQAKMLFRAQRMMKEQQKSSRRKK